MSGDSFNTVKKIVLFLCLLWVGLACSDNSASQKAQEQAELHTSVQTDSTQILLLLCLAVLLIASAGIFFYMREQQIRMFRELKHKEWELRDKIARLEHEREVGSLNERATIMREQLFRQMSASEKIPSLGGRKWGRKRHDEPEDENELPRLTEDEIENVVKLVNNVAWSGFADRLKATYPLLKKSEIQFCCLLRAGISVKELSAIYSITQQAVCQRKIRIKRNKMNLHNDRRVLDNILKDFDKEYPQQPTP